MKKTLALAFLALSVFAFAAPARADVDISFVSIDHDRDRGWHRDPHPWHRPPPPYFYRRPVFYNPPPVYVVPPPRVVVYSQPTTTLVAAPSSPTYIDQFGRTCREYQSTGAVAGGYGALYGTACLQPDGTWRIVQ